MADGGGPSESRSTGTRADKLRHTIDGEGDGGAAGEAAVSAGGGEGELAVDEALGGQLGEENASGGRTGGEHVDRGTLYREVAHLRGQGVGEGDTRGIGDLCKTKVTRY